MLSSIRERVGHVLEASRLRRAAGRLHEGEAAEVVAAARLGRRAAEDREGEGAQARRAAEERQGLQVALALGVVGAVGIADPDPVGGHALAAAREGQLAVLAGDAPLARPRRDGSAVQPATRPVADEAAERPGGAWEISGRGRGTACKQCGAPLATPGLS
ncbi:hypothetical protein ACR8AQ_11885 [Clavibacter sepedonicus]|uniref:hypothetical protein n=1 Tax=Clavibacter sepedonicus TaxID=31964 RepID=UPI003DA61859